MWPGVYPEEDVVNYTYLNQVNALINKLGATGIYTLVDMHQDLLSNWFCGEGVPDWAVNYTRVGVKNFAEPLYGELPRDNVTHKINSSICFEHTFGVYYETDIVGNLFDCLYDATCNPFSPYNTTGNTTKIVMLQQ